jgi:hypothetical protein
MGFEIPQVTYQQQGEQQQLHLPICSCSEPVEKQINKKRGAISNGILVSEPHTVQLIINNYQHLIKDKTMSTPREGILPIY